MWCIILIIIAVITLAIIGLYNSLVTLRMQVQNAWSQIDVQLQRRFDLIPNFVETVKGYVTHEKETLEKICDVLGTTTDYLLGIGEVDVANAKINSIQRGLSKLGEKDLERAEGILRLAFTEAFGGE